MIDTPQIIVALQAERQKHLTAAQQIDDAIKALNGKPAAAAPAAPKRKMGEHVKLPNGFTFAALAAVLTESEPQSVEDVASAAHALILNVHRKRVPLRKIRKAIWNACYKGSITRDAHDMLTLTRKEK